MNLQKLFIVEILLAKIILSMCRFNIKDGKVKYNSRFLRSKTYIENEKAGMITRSEFGTPSTVRKGLFSRYVFVDF